MRRAATANDDVPIMTEMNMTPLIDVMLVLIITLILSIPIQQHMVKLNMPSTEPHVNPPPQVAVLDIDFDGVVYWNGAALADRAALAARLHAAAQASVQPALQVHASRLVPYKLVMGVLTLIKNNQLSDVALIGNT